MNFIHDEETGPLNYILAEPHAESDLDTFVVAAEELLKPIGAIAFEDFPSLSALTGGVRPSEFTIVCAPTGVGKTTLVANFSKSLLKQGMPHFVASVETGRTDFMRRVMSAMIREDWNTGHPVAAEKIDDFKVKYAHYFQRKNLWLSLYENRFSVEQLMSDIAWMVVHNKCKIAIIDNLNFFLDVKRSADQLVEMDRVIHELIIFCKQVDVHVIMIMHPKKTEHGRVESEFDIKGSATAVQEAHNVFLFNRISENLVAQGLAGPSDRELKIAKMRRRGRAVGKRLILKSIQGVAYDEGDIV